jgi:glycerol uptake facilitator-like aquaporin
MRSANAMRDLPRALAAETLGTALLLAAVVGSGIMAERLSPDTAVALLCNTIATGAMLAVIITSFAPVSGAHFNPAITLLAMLDRILPLPNGVAYIAAQVAGGIAGVLVAHAMFAEPLFAWGINERAGAAQWLSEGVAVFGLVLTIEAARGRTAAAVAALVALYIIAAYWFTASTSFANPAVTIARSLTPTFAGIRPADVPGFISAQLLGAAMAWALSRWMFGAKRVAL